MWKYVYNKKDEKCEIARPIAQPLDQLDIYKLV